MKKFFIAAALLTAGTSAQALDVGGAMVNGEASFDYQSVSGGAKTTNTGFIDKAANEAYAMRDATLTFAKDGDVTLFGRMSFRPSVFKDSTNANATTDIALLDSLELGYKINPDLVFSFGRLQTTFGFEQIEKNLNPIYNNSIAFNIVVPTFFEGVRLKYTMSPLMAATLSSYNNGTRDGAWGKVANTGKSTELAISGKNDMFAYFAGHQIGNDAASLALTHTSIWASYKMDAYKFILAFDGRTKTPSTGAADFGQALSATATYQIAKHNLALRYEAVYGAKWLYATLPVAATLNTNTVNSLVIGDKIALNDNMKVFAEYRMDTAKDEAFFDGKGVATKTASSALLGLAAHF